MLFPKRLQSSLYTLCTLLIITTTQLRAADPTSEESIFQKPLLINLKEFAAEGQKRLDSIFRPDPSPNAFNAQIPQGQILFADGYSSNGPGLIFDQARLYYLTTLPANTGLSPGLYRDAYFIAAQGYSSIGFVDIPEHASDPINFHEFGGAISYKAGTDKKVISAKALAYQKQFPTFIFQSFSLLPLITVELPEKTLPTAETADDFAELLTLIKADPSVSYWENQSEFFPIPYAFAKPIALDSSASDTIIDVNALRSLSVDAGIPITIPSWPEPFGPGRIPNPATHGHPTLDPLTF